MSIEVHTPEEFLDFFAAYVATMEESQRLAVESRTLIIETREAWTEMAADTLQRGHVLVAHPRLHLESHLVAEAVAHGHHVLLCASGPVQGGMRVELRRPLRYNLEKNLITAGVSDSRAEQIAHNAGGSIAIIKRWLSTVGSNQPPAWLIPDRAASLVAFLLIGSWDESVEADCHILEVLHDMTYQSVVRDARSLEKTGDPLLHQVGMVWRLVSPLAAWEQLGRFLTALDMQKFEKAVLEVLGEVDPALELPIEQRWLATTKGKRLRHSSELRQGLAQSLALMGIWNERTDQPSLQGLELSSKVRQCVIQLLLKKDIATWVSLAGLLPLLAEASPEAFLEAIEGDLQQSAPVLVRMFQDGGDSHPLFSSSLYTELLWALEGLAWSPRYLTRTALILAKLDMHDPSRRLGNSSHASLRQIFLSWKPQTAANESERIGALKRILEKFPVEGRTLLISLLPKSQDNTSPIYHPRWRNWHLDEQPVLMSAYREYVRHLFGLLLDSADKDPMIYVEMAESLDDLSSAEFERYAQRLSQHCRESLGFEIADALWEKLRSLSARHKSHPTADWSLPERVLREFDALASLFIPNDAAVLYRHLFSRWSLFEETESTSDSDGNQWELRRRDLERKQLQALNDILERPNGFEQLLSLAEIAEQAGLIGILIGRYHSPSVDVARILSCLGSNSPKLRELASGFIQGKTMAGGLEWLDHIEIRASSSEQQGIIHSLLPFTRPTWRRVEKLNRGAQNVYWENVNIWTVAPEAVERERGIRLLIENGRADLAVWLIAMIHEADPAIASDLYIEVLRAVASIPSAHPLTANRYQAVSHVIREIFAVLQVRTDVDPDTLASLEFAFLEFLDGHGALPRTLHRMMSENPGLFVNLLQTAFKGDGKHDDNDEVDNGKRLAAQKSFRLIRSLDRIPGVQEDGSIATQVLNTWIQEVRHLADQCGRLRICDSFLGQLLAKSPSDAEGNWPSQPICDALEKVATSSFENGLFVGICNQRGIYRKDPYEGGIQERSLASTFRTRACKLAAFYPRTAKVLNDVAESYERQASQEDIEAKLRA